MTPDQARKLDELYEDLQRRRIQQISHPLDDASKNIVGSVIDEGTGSSTLTQTIALSGNAQNIDVPAAYTDTEIINIGGKRMEIPVISYP